jgi:(1->4)-alpha-D-glucan 1-alpha-D-glucosylmutase
MRVLADDGDHRFLDDLLPFQQRVAFFGQFNSLAQTVLKLTSPGVPDTYQGTELWDLSLVDPDNRRPVAFERRQAMLTSLRQQVEQAGDGLPALVTRLLADSHDGCIKLYVTYRTLTFRREHEHLFADGAYLPLETSGARRDHVCVFARVLGEETAIVVAPRLVVGLTGGVEQPPLGPDVWGDTWLALPSDQVGQPYRNLFTGEVLAVQAADGEPGLPLAAILGHAPVALLERLAG